MDLTVRDLVAFPPGDNSSDTLIGGIHWNLTTLEHWNYQYYSNGTFSNGSLCFVIFEPYTPFLLQNGTFLNTTSCYSPIEALGTRSKIGLAFACLFAASIMFTFINLRKHGKSYLPTEKRFRLIGRRWQWYWMLAVAAFALISSITNVDVDRYYLSELPIVLSNFFWFLMLPSTLAVVWESVRHWGSWQERQMIDPNPFVLRQDDRRSKVELYLPLLFYFCFWMNFFMVVPRSWTPIELQRSPSQTTTVAAPSATDIRFKIASLFLLFGWLTTAFSLRHSIKHYKPLNRGFLNRAIGFIKYIPNKFLLTMPLSLALIGYGAACSFSFTISPLNLHTNLGFMYGLGWGLPAAILFIYEVAGYIDPNDDRELIRQRRIRGAEIDQEMNITKKPHWWSRLHGNNMEVDVHEQIARNVGEIGGGRVTSKNIERNIEMGNMPVSRRDPNKPGKGDLDAIRVAANLLFPVSVGTERSDPFQDTPIPGNGRGMTEGERIGVGRPPTSERSDSSNTGVSIGGPPQKIRSMLDV